MANEINTLQRATIDDDTAHALAAGGYAVTSSDEDVATTEVIGGYWFVVAQGAGTATISAERLADGATSNDLEVTVTEAPGAGTFVIQLGAISAQ